MCVCERREWTTDGRLYSFGGGGKGVEREGEGG